MADTATSNLDLLYLQVGSPNREIVVNDGLRVLDTVTAGTLTIDVSGSGDYVLTDGVTGEAKYGRIKLTGTLTGDRAIIVPQLGRQYLIFNGTSGAFALTVKPPTGLSETIEPSTWALLVCDGTDIFRPLTGGGGGSGSVPGGSAGQVQYNNGAGAFAGSSGLVLSATQVTSIDLASPLAVSEGGTGAVTAGQARDNLGLTIGSTVQGYDATLAALAGLSTSANQLAYFTGVDAAALTPLSTFMRTLLDDADATAGRATLEIVAASETQAGLVELATTAEVQTGTDTTRAVTPAGLTSRSATETRTGLLEVATTAEVTTGTDDSRALTPLKLAQRLAALPTVPAASETVAGIAEVATTAEVTTGTDDTRLVSPLKLAQRLAAIPAVPAASETVAGLVELATTAETVTGTDPTRATHPAGVTAALDARVPAGTPLSVARYASSGLALESAPGVFTTAASGQFVLGSNTFNLGAANLLVGERDGTTQLTVTAGAITAGAGAAILVRGTRGPLSAPAAVTTNDLLGAFYLGGYDGGAFTNTAISLRGLAAETWNGSAHGTLLSLSTTLIGATASAERLRLDGQGNLTTWGALCGLGTPLTATLGSGASYQALNVKGSQLFVGQSSTQERPISQLTATLPVPTDATRTGRLTVSAYDAVGAREGLRVEADGTAARLSFFGQTAVVRQTVPAAATDAGTTQTLANSLRTALVNLGLCV